MWFGIPVLLFLSAAANMFGGTFGYSLCVFCTIMINYRETFLIELHRATIYYLQLLVLLHQLSIRCTQYNTLQSAIIFDTICELMHFAMQHSVGCGRHLPVGWASKWAALSISSHGIFIKQTAAKHRNNTGPAALHAHHTTAAKPVPNHFKYLCYLMQWHASNDNDPGLKHRESWP